MPPGAMMTTGMCTRCYSAACDCPRAPEDKVLHKARGGGAQAGDLGIGGEGPNVQACRGRLLEQAQQSCAGWPGRSHLFCMLRVQACSARMHPRAPPPQQSSSSAPRALTVHAVGSLIRREQGDRGRSQAGAIPGSRFDGDALHRQAAEDEDTRAMCVGSGLGTVPRAAVPHAASRCCQACSAAARSPAVAL